MAQVTADGLTVGYAAMLEQFHPTEVLELAAHAETARLLRRHGRRPLPAVDPAAGPGILRLERAERARRDARPATSAPASPHPPSAWHPAMVAQASATLAAMYPGRHWLGLGSGEALNEHVVGAATGPTRPSASTACSRPSTSSRSCSRAGTAARTSATRASTTGSNRRGSGRCRNAPPTILVAASGPVTAKRAGRTVDGLITEAAPADKLGPLLQRFAEGAQRGGPRRRARCPRCCRLHLSWAATDEEAMQNALTEWPNLGMRFGKSDIRSPLRARADGAAWSAPRTSRAGCW